MHDLFVRPFEHAYMQRALLEVVLLGVLGGVVGVHVLLRKLAFVTEVVQHTVFPGIAIAFVVGQSLLVGALVAGALSMLLLTLGSRRTRVAPDALMALLISTFFAAGVIIVSRQRTYQSDL
ncbi:MAG TPA: metal ABC transporter permease, partial [Ilumatobacteraceae bacterium]